MKVFADTSGLFASLVRNDRNHPRALEVMQRLLMEKHDLVTTSYVLTETVVLMQSRVGFEAVRELTRTLCPLMEVVWIDKRLHERAMVRLLGMARRRVGIVDCASFEVMGDLGIGSFFGFDGHFAEQGFTPF